MVRMLSMSLSMPAAKKGAGKGKPSRGTATADPTAAMSLNDWINLGAENLEKSCELANLLASGTIVDMASRLFEYYQQMARETQHHPLRVQPYRTASSASDTAPPTLSFGIYPHLGGAQVASSTADIASSLSSFFDLNATPLTSSVDVVPGGLISSLFATSDGSTPAAATPVTSQEQSTSSGGQVSASSSYLPTPQGQNVPSVGQNVPSVLPGTIPGTSLTQSVPPVMSTSSAPSSGVPTFPSFRMPVQPAVQPAAPPQLPAQPSAVPSAQGNPTIPTAAPLLPTLRVI